MYVLTINNNNKSRGQKFNDRLISSIYLRRNVLIHKSVVVKKERTVEALKNTTMCPRFCLNDDRVFNGEFNCGNFLVCMEQSHDSQFIPTFSKLLPYHEFPATVG